MSRELAWQSILVRPTMTLTGPAGSATFWLGTFELDTPSAALGDDPTTWTVEGYDLLARLDDGLAATYEVSAGASYLGTVRTLLDEVGVPSAIAGDADGTTLATARVWPLGEATRLRVINDLLDAVGYRALHIDYAGRAVAQPYVAPRDRAAEFVYSLNDVVGTVVARQSTRELYDVPNRWVGIRDDPDPDAAAPTVGDGIYIAVNQSEGAGSIDARGRTVTRTLKVDVADQAALVAYVDRVAQQDRSVTRHLTLQVDPNPLHGHFDVVAYDDPKVSVGVPWVVDRWTLPLDGSPMTVEARRVRP